MADKAWITLCDKSGNYLADVAKHLPRNGEQVRFESMNRIFVGTFHASSRSRYFRSEMLKDILFLVVGGKPCEVFRWTTANDAGLKPSGSTLSA
jgi:hypothetical protein